jgi:hypothetical protein
VDNLDFGLTADRRAVPDIDHLGDLLAVAFEELSRAVGVPVMVQQAERMTA